MDDEKCDILDSERQEESGLAGILKFYCRFFRFYYRSVSEITTHETVNAELVTTDKNVFTNEENAATSKPDSTDELEVNEKTQKAPSVYSTGSTFSRDVKFKLDFPFTYLDLGERFFTYEFLVGLDFGKNFSKLCVACI